MKPNTIDGLRDALDDNDKQLAKAEEKYRTLMFRHNSIEDAIHELQQRDAGGEFPQGAEAFPQD